MAAAGELIGVGVGLDQGVLFECVIGTTVEGVVNRFLVDPESSRSALAFVAGLPFKPKKRR